MACDTGASGAPPPPPQKTPFLNLRQTSRKAKQFWVVLRGHTTGIHRTWLETAVSITGYPSAIYEGFDTLEEAEAAWAAINRGGPDSLFSDTDAASTPTTSPARVPPPTQQAFAMPDPLASPTRNQDGSGRAPATPTGPRHVQFASPGARQDPPAASTGAQGTPTSPSLAPGAPAARTSAVGTPPRVTSGRRAPPASPTSPATPWLQNPGTSQVFSERYLRYREAIIAARAATHAPVTPPRRAPLDPAPPSEGPDSLSHFATTDGCSCARHGAPIEAATSSQAASSPSSFTFPSSRSVSSATFSESGTSPATAGTSGHRHTMSDDDVFDIVDMTPDGDRHYAIVSGWEVGIVPGPFDTIRRYINGHPCCQFKGFQSYEEALEWFAKHRANHDAHKHD
ncbi:hypothetical protein BV25DRAFT_1841593 [Artomyces pyxidatus]|uniref:Uncharacterized protein n=1 Tax=Artomyces pyxidatus TaxID=48021 RepID=A0ACB8SMN2_9AGAM|nr:hypothetical protein BV25DRAFT_1841593 [Artomyces pyxidatus]